MTYPLGATDRIRIYRGSRIVSLPLSVFKDYISNIVAPFWPNTLNLPSYPNEPALDGTEITTILKSGKSIPVTLAVIKAFIIGTPVTSQLSPFLASFPAYPILDGSEIIMIRQGSGMSGFNLTQIQAYTGSGSTALPALANLAGRWSASEATPQADNTNFASWTDTVDNAVAAASNAAGFKYRTNVAGGLPAIQCLGISEMPIAFTGKRFANAIASGIYTALFVMRGPASANADGSPFGAFGGTRPICMVANNARLGTSSRGYVPYATPANEIVTLSVNDSVNINGLPVARWSDQPCATSGGTMAIAGFGNGYSLAYFNGYIFDVLFWDIQLSPLQMVQAEKWARERYADALPWAGALIKIIDGNSLTADYSTNKIQECYSTLIAAARGWKPGTWANTAVVGRNSFTALSDFNTKTKPFLDIIGRPTILSYFEWINGQVTTGRSEAQNLIDVQNYLLGIENAGIACAFGTSMDFGGAGATAPNIAARANYNAYWDIIANRNAYGIDQYIAIHNNANIGVVGANANATYFMNDFVHDTPAGHVVLQGLFQPALVSMGG